MLARAQHDMAMAKARGQISEKNGLSQHSIRVCRGRGLGYKTRVYKKTGRQGRREEEGAGSAATEGIRQGWVEHTQDTAASRKMSSIRGV